LTKHFVFDLPLVIYSNPLIFLSLFSWTCQPSENHREASEAYVTDLGLRQQRAIVSDMPHSIQQTSTKHFAS
jgi:hypothetical protein